MKRAATILSGAIFALLLVAGGGAATATAAAGGLPSAIKIDRAAKTATFPLFKGKTATGKATWYVITESSNRADATRRGVNYAPKLANALGTGAVQRATVAGGTVRFPGTVNFRPVQRVVAGPSGFPPSVATPGAALRFGTKVEASSAAAAVSEASVLR